MISKVVTKIFGSRNSRLIKRMQQTVTAINALEEGVAALSDEALQARTGEFRSRLEQGETIDQLLPEVFAVVRETAKRVLHMRHFDVQLIGGMVLHEGKISEMRTGEGKTLVATLAVYLNALPNKGVHVVTVNDYLARRDAEWMGKVYTFLGLTTGVVVSGQDSESKRAAYAADITYGTNNEFGFDYLRDNMAFRAEERFQRGTHFAVIDEVDSILIDEARTPLIISGPAEESADLYQKINTIAPMLTAQKEEDGEGDYSVDEKGKQVHLTEAGHERVETLLAQSGILEQGGNLYDPANIALLHHLTAALRAHSLYQREVDYIIKDGEVVIIDEFTGRMMPGRRWSDGLHQAVEAKEGVKIQSENQTLASITFQNYFRLYGKLSGMTGTADTEAFELQSIYGLEVVVVPTHRPMIRQDMGDQIYRTSAEKHAAIVEDIRDCHKREQPVLVGTISIESSEHLSKVLKQEKIPHEVLNAKQHEREAHIVADAGKPGAITIATNMAGRGTDIVLGGNLEMELEGVDESQAEKVREDWQVRHEHVLEAGGLHVIGTERHESRRIDNQLRGRSGRQGDPGSSRFYLSLEDSLMRIFASERVSNIMLKLGMQEGEAIEHPLVTRAIENAQRKVEGRNFDIRKQLLEYDNVANDQRHVIYDQRNLLMDSESIADNIVAIRKEVLNDVIDLYIPRGSMEEQWDVPGLEQTLEQEFATQLSIQQWLDDDAGLEDEKLREKVVAEFERLYNEKVATYGEPIMREAESVIMLQVLDREWKEHLAAMDYLRQGIHLRGYAQKNPKDEFKREAFMLFTEMLSRIKLEAIRILTIMQIQAETDMDSLAASSEPDESHMQYSHPELGQPQLPEENAPAAVDNKPIVRSGRKIGRNEPCPCGSGKKYKHCHGRVT
ncbi:MAG: preprotein translocase subunit SecA [Gammaproteobacteria bacterium]|nr:MAG: preprotein translocase subunit SecA [Gammaproteobacteria bacterium]